MHHRDRCVSHTYADTDIGNVNLQLPDVLDLWGQVLMLQVETETKSVMHHRDRCVSHTYADTGLGNVRHT